MKFSIVVAADEKMGIGLKNRLPWRLNKDLNHFSSVTIKAPLDKVNAVIMGRKTWESLPDAHRPLKGRVNIVLSRLASGGSIADTFMEKPTTESENDSHRAVLFAGSLDMALREAEALPDINKAFVIGGANVYAQAMEHPDCEKIYLTEVQGEFECDAFFPKIDLGKFKKVNESEEQEEGGVKFRFVEYELI